MVDEVRRLVHSASKLFLQSSTTSISILYAISLALGWQQPRRFPLPGAFSMVEWSIGTERCMQNMA